MIMMSGNRMTLQQLSDSGTMSGQNEMQVNMLENESILSQNTNNYSQMGHKGGIGAAVDQSLNESNIQFQIAE